MSREFAQTRFVRPPGSCEILLLRHGASAPLRDGESFPLVDGHGDPPLAPNGIVQAERAAERLLRTGEPIAAVYVTSLRRTHQTAAPLVTGLGIEPIVEADLREVYLGDWEGGEFRRRVAAGDPLALKMHEEQRWDAIPNGESWESIEHRVGGAIRRIATTHADELVVAVIHGGIIGAIMNMAAGIRGFTFGGAENCSLSHVIVDGDRWHIRGFNDATHVTPTLSYAPG